MNRLRGCLLALVAIAAAAALPANARAPVRGSLYVLPAPRACAAAKPRCLPARGLDGVAAILIGPEGRTLHAASRGAGTVTTFVRQPLSGALQQYAGAAGCLAAAPRPGCGLAPALAGARRLAAAPDGSALYAVVDGGLATIARDAPRGVLGPVSLLALPGALDVAAAPGGRYVAALADEGLVTFARDPATGALSRPPDPACEPEDPGDEPPDPGEEPEDPGDPGEPPPEPPPPPEPCPPLPAFALEGAVRLVPSPDGAHLLAIAADYTSVLAVDAATGELAEEDGYETAPSPCPPGLTCAPGAATVRTADGQSSYTAARAGKAGALVAYSAGAEIPQPLPGTAACLAGPRPPRAARCGREARLLAPAADLALAPDGRYLYAALPRALIVLGIRFR